MLHNVPQCYPLVKFSSLFLTTFPLCCYHFIKHTCVFTPATFQPSWLLLNLLFLTLYYICSVLHCHFVSPHSFYTYKFISSLWFCQSSLFFIHTSSFPHCHFVNPHSFLYTCSFPRCHFVSPLSFLYIYMLFPHCHFVIITKKKTCTFTIIQSLSLIHYNLFTVLLQ